MKKILVIMMVLLSIGSFASASDIILSDTLIQEEFDQVIKELGAVLVFNPMAPAEPLGITGFDIGIEVVASDIGDNEEYWAKFIENGDTYSYLPVPRVHIQKGLPFNIDVGAMYVYVPDSNIKLWGAEIKYAILEGTTVTPALAVRASYSKLEGVDDIDLNTQSLDLLISKGFVMLTPYAGVSVTRISGSETNDTLPVDLEEVTEVGYKGLVGLQISPFPLFNITLEASLGEVVQYGLKVGLRF